MKKRIVKSRIHVVSRPDASGSSGSLIGQIWWRLVGAAVRLCIRVTDTVQRAIIATTCDGLSRALQVLRDRNLITQQQVDEVWAELRSSNDPAWSLAAARG